MSGNYTRITSKSPCTPFSSNCPHKCISLSSIFISPEYFISKFSENFTFFPKIDPEILCFLFLRFGFMMVPSKFLPFLEVISSWMGNSSWVTPSKMAPVVKNGNGTAGIVLVRFKKNSKVEEFPLMLFSLIVPS